MNVTVLSGGPSMNSCTLLCWSVAPSAPNGVGPTPLSPGLAMLAQALGPELHEPVGDVAQRIGVRHQHVDVPAELRVGEVLKRREDPGRILRQHVACCSARAMSSAPANSSAVSIPTSAAGRMPTGVSTLNRPPTAGGMSSAGMPSLVRDFTQRALLRIGDEDEMLAARRRPCRSAARER